MSKSKEAPKAAKPGFRPMATLRTWISRLSIEDAENASPPNLTWYFSRRRRRRPTIQGQSYRFSSPSTRSPTTASSSIDLECEFSQAELCFAQFVGVGNTQVGKTSAAEGRNVPRFPDDELSQAEIAETLTRGTNTSLLLACPYLKYDPAKYGQRKSCRGAAFSKTHRLKEHLHRIHRQTPNCPRCHRTFKAEAEVASHLKASSLCEVIEGEGLTEGFDAVQERLLRSKRRRAGVKTKVDKWREIFRILFPNHKDVPDPFYRIPFDEQDTTMETPTKEQGDTESIFMQAIPSDVENGTYSEMEEAIGQRLDDSKRRKLLDVFKGFAVKMILQPAPKKTIKRDANLVSKYSGAREISQTRRQLKIQSENQPLEKAGGRLDVELDEVDAMSSATQTIIQPTERVTSLGVWPGDGGAEERSVFPDSESLHVDFSNNINNVMYWPTWEAAFPHVIGDVWLDDLLEDGSTLPGLLAEEPGTALGTLPATTVEGVDPIPR
ncbi:hypothetical protein CSIM01_07046 [Colletotrichum simmondsii]|uniref:C2H2-type domain-containing protein n=1 Tax=Colletotrichum simmondsii TaxID=703756 RepID=A0A135RTP8_9PEZI|nr:hypothetical protein CSIM01_07046 [Colletotrichum simmondsii]